jgi:hypothetical protein
MELLTRFFIAYYTGGSTHDCRVSAEQEKGWGAPDGNDNNRRVGGRTKKGTEKKKRQADRREGERKKKEWKHSLSVTHQAEHGD